MLTGTTKRHVLLLVIFAIPAAGVPCLWVDGTTIDGEPVEFNASSVASLLRTRLNADPSDVIRQFKYETRERVRESLALREFEAVEHIVAGEVEAGIETLLAIEAEFPVRYETAANLGTAYELAGRPEEALRWIKEAVRRNPESHYGTEWLHIFILETKLQLENEPEVFASKRILPLPETFGAETPIAVGGTEYLAWEVAHALRYQLKERMVFVKPEDLIVAELLFALGRINAQLEVVEFGLELLDLAERYGFPDGAAMREWRERYAEVQEQGRRRRAMRRMAYFGAGSLLFAGLMVYWKRSGMRVW